MIFQNSQTLDEFYRIVTGQTIKKNTSSQVVERILQDRVVLVTGAGGSIGTAIFKQLQQYKIKEIILVDIDESRLNQLEVTTNFVKDNLTHNKTKIYFEFCDIREMKELEKLYNKYLVNIVIHCAAIKFLPIAEKNPEKAFLTNIIGTNNLISVSNNCKTVSHFLNISTDKAAEPSSVLGITKKIAENLVLNRFHNYYFSNVRFGNVFGSRGSVIETFANRFENNLSIQIHHKEMERYFMTSNQAAELCLFSLCLMEKNKSTYIFDMGKPISIYKIAINMRDKFFGESRSVIEITTPKPGEKIKETLVASDESQRKTEFINIFEISSQKKLKQDFDITQFNNLREREITKITLIDILKLMYE